MSLITTAAPSAANRSAISRPRPEPAPVINATLLAIRPGTGWSVLRLSSCTGDRFRTLGRALVSQVCPDLTVPAAWSRYGSLAALPAADMHEDLVMTCDDVRRTISDADGRWLHRRRIRSHLRDCNACAAFAAAVSERKVELRALVPPLPALAAAGVLARVAGGGSGPGGAGAAAVAAGAGKTVGAALAAKTVAVMAIAATATAGATIALTRSAPRSSASRTAPVRPAAAIGNQRPGAAIPLLDGGRLSGTRHARAGRHRSAGAASAAGHRSVGAGGPGTAASRSAKAGAPRSAAAAAHCVVTLDRVTHSAPPALRRQFPAENRNPRHAPVGDQSANPRVHCT